MSRQLYNDGQEIIFQDLNAMQSRSEQEIYDRVIFEMLSRAEDRFFADGFSVSFFSSVAVIVNSGLGFQTDAAVSATEPQKRLLYKANNQTVNIAAADTVNDRIDLVVVKHARAVTSTESRKFKNASTSVITNENLEVAEDWDAEVLIVQGTPAPSPVAPSVPAGYIKIAELFVNAVAGITGSGDITDTRNIMPIAGNATINSSAFVRLTQSATLAIQQAFEETDALLKNGTLDDNIFIDSVTDPAAPVASGAVKLYNKGGLLFIRDDLGAVTPVGAGGGGGGAGANWVGTALEDEEFGQPVKRFGQGDSQKETLFIRVPNGYLAGRQISAFLGAYSPASSNEFKMQLVSTLIRKGQDAMDSFANQETNDTGDITNDNANEYRELGVDISTPTGQINGFSVSPGDLIKLELTRIAPTGTEDTEDIRFIPSATEIKFG